MIFLLNQYNIIDTVFYRQLIPKECTALNEVTAPNEDATPMEGTTPIEINNS